LYEPAIVTSDLPTKLINDVFGVFRFFSFAPSSQMRRTLIARGIRFWPQSAGYDTGHGTPLLKHAELV
jgi:hypothetical protein